MRSLVWVGLVLLAAPAVAAPADGLVGSWRLDSAGPEIKDLSGRGHTAKVAGGTVVEIDGRKALRNPCVEVPSAPELNLKRGFSIEARFRPDDLSQGHNIVAKEGEYLLRADWPIETNRLSFFVCLAGAMEPRTSAYRLADGTWYHVVAVWDGLQSLLWVNGQPFAGNRAGEAPAPTDSPLVIGGPAGGTPFPGCIEYVNLYNRALTSAEVIRRAYGIADTPQANGAAQAAFDFRKGLQGWAGREGAAVAATPAGLKTTTRAAGSLVLHDHLSLDIDKRDYLCLRMAVDKGSRSEIVFATTKGAGRIPFQVYADGAPHSYVLEPWQAAGWAGKLLALGIVPSEVPQASARIEYVRVCEQPDAEPEIRVAKLFTDSVLPRAGRTEKVIARVTNTAGPGTGVSVRLRVPAGVTVVGPAAQRIAKLGYQEEREVSWQVRASAPVRAEFTVTAGGSSLSAPLTFQKALRVAKAAYVPVPKPVTGGKYTIWTHYCPLWKQGTHTGWKAIEPYPERKPILGWYNEGTPEVADWHIKMWLEHGISGVIYCWYRTNLNGPVQQALGHALHDGLLKARYLNMIRFGIMWENGCGKGCGSQQDLMENVLPFWLDNYFTNPSYLKIDAKPVLYIWVPGNVTRDLGGSENVRRTFDLMREKCRQRGLAGLYIVGCVGTADKAALQRMAAEGWDASSAYGNGWVQPAQVRSEGRFVCAPYEGFVQQQEKIWQSKSAWGLLPDITAAMMGWDSRPWNETSFFWSDNTPEKFRDLCRRAKAVMDAKPTNGPEKKTAIFCCWNEFGEGHYIEPTRGYGYSYLDAIRDVFTDAPREHTDLAPEDVGLGPYDSWYRQARAAAPASGPSADTSWAGAKLAAWSGMMGLENVATKNGVLTAITSTSDPAFGSPALKIRASRFTKVVVEMRVSKPADVQLFWASASEPHLTEASSLHAKAPADGQFHPCVFEVGRNEHWGGCVISMRLDPCSEAGVKVEIRGIRLE